MSLKKTYVPGRYLAIALICSSALLALNSVTHARTKVPSKIHKVVFEMSVDGMPKWESVARNAENVQKSFGPQNTRIVIVAHGPGIGLVLAKNSIQNPELKALIQRLHQNGVIFAACRNTLTRLKIDPKELLQIATIVDSGVAEVIRRQEAGWTYIKSG